MHLVTHPFGGEGSVFSPEPEFSHIPRNRLLKARLVYNRLNKHRSVAVPSINRLERLSLPAESLVYFDYQRPWNNKGMGHPIMVGTELVDGHRSNVRFINLSYPHAK